MDRRPDASTMLPMISDPETWEHVYDPFGSPLVSTLAAVTPLVVLLGLLACAGWPAHRAVMDLPCRPKATPPA